MTKISLLPIHQKDKIFYSMVADPRVICALTKFNKTNEVQEYQRPWKEKKVKEIAKLVGGNMPLNPDAEKEKIQIAKGIIPNCPILQLIDSKKIVKEGESYFLLIGDSDEELFETPIDGQHRLMAFDPDYCSIQDDETYEMCFIVFTKLSLNDKRELFIICNDKQDKVPKEVTLAQKQAMGLLSNDVDFYYSLVESLDKEVNSPYKDRLKINGEYIVSGLSPSSLVTFIKGSTFLSYFDDANKRDRFLTYIFAWGDVFDEEMHDKKHPLFKANGFNFIMMVAPDICEIFKTLHRPFTEENLKEILIKLKNICESESIFNSSNFGGQTPSTNIAHEMGRKLIDECIGEGGFQL